MDVYLLSCLPKNKEPTWDQVLWGVHALPSLTAAMAQAQEMEGLLSVEPNTLRWSKMEGCPVTALRAGSSGHTFLIRLVVMATPIDTGTPRPAMSSLQVSAAFHRAKQAKAQRRRQLKLRAKT